MSLISSWFTPLANLFRGRGGFANNNSWLMGQKGPVWLDYMKPQEMYNIVPQLKAVVDKRAMMYAAGMPRLRNIKTQEVVDVPEFSKLMNNPNPTQGMNDWLVNLKQQKLIYGNQFIYKNKARAAQYPGALWNISPRYMQPVLTGKVFRQTDFKKIVSKYVFEVNGDIEDFETQEIIWSKINDLDNPLIGLSPIFSLKFPLTNIIKAYEYRNVTLGAPGGIGILSSAPSKDMTGFVPMGPGVKKVLDKEFGETWGTGEGKKPVRVSEAPLNWQAMNYALKEMLTFEEIEADLSTICDTYGMNRNLFLSNTTYENLKHGMIQTFQDTIIPDADKDTQLWTKEFNIPEGFEIFMDYSHVSILKNDNTEETNNFATKSKAISELVTAGIMTKAEAKTIIDGLLKEINSQ